MCGIELADFLMANDHVNKKPGTENTITLHTIGFQLGKAWRTIYVDAINNKRVYKIDGIYYYDEAGSEPVPAGTKLKNGGYEEDVKGTATNARAVKFLKRLASLNADGNRNFYAAETADDLLKAFNNIIAEAMNARTVIVNSPTTARLINISSRAPVRGGTNNAIAGFIIRGTGTKKVVIRADGAGLGNRWNGAKVLADSKIVLYQMINGSYQVIATNDNWQSDSRANEMPDEMQQLLASSDAGLVMNLAPGTYTAIVQPATGNTTTGIALVSVNDVDDTSTSKLINISTLAPIEGGQSNVIAGFIITGTGTKQVVVTAQGKSVKLPPERLCQDTTMNVYKMANGKSTEVANNDDWQEGAQAARIPTHLKPSEPSDAALLLNLGAGAYSAIMGCIGGTGIGSIGVNAVD